MKLAKNERLNLWGLSRTFGLGVAKQVEALTQSVQKLLDSEDPVALYEALHYIRSVKRSIQSVHNFNHELTCLAAKAFLEPRYPSVVWEEVGVLARDTNAPGADILYGDDQTKTTDPARGKTTDFGSEQRTEIIKDLKVLSSKQYDEFDRYFFVTNPLSFDILSNKYRSQCPSINFVLLRNADTQELSGPTA